MADRVVKVRYEAIVGGAVANVKKLAAATDDYATKGADRVRKHEAAFSHMTTGITVGAVAAGAALGVVTKAWMGFDQEMSGVQAVAGATTEQMAQLEQAALDLGASTVFSASEVASAQAELVRAGVSVEDMLNGGLKGALDLAAAGGLELADASIIAAQAMNLFNLEGSDVGHVADVLASGANKSAADVSDLGQALGQAGTVASQTGLSLEETVAALSMFADEGIRGSDAGTSLKTMLQRLTPQSKEAKRTMEELGFSAFDAAGNFIGLEGLASELQDSFGGLDTESRQAALGVAFGSDAIRGASILMEGGAEAAREYEAAMNDTGAASRMAATMTDNLAGDLEELGGAIETALIQGGKNADGVLRDITQGLTGVVEMASEAPRWLQETTLGLAGIATVGGLGVAGVLKVGTSLVSLGDDIANIAGKATRTSKILSGVGGVLTGPWGLAMVAGVGALSAFAIEQGRARVEAEELRSTLDEQTGAITDNTTALLTKQLQDSGWLETYAKWGGDVRDLAGYLNDDADATARFNAVIAENHQRMIASGSVNEQYGTEAQELRVVLQGMADDAAVQGELQREFAAAMEDTTTSAEGGVVALTNLATGLAEYATQQHAAAGGTDLWLSRTEQMTLLGEEAVEVMADWKEHVAELSGSFISVDEALAANDEKAKAWAEGQAEATESAEDSWEDYVADASFSLDTFLAKLEEQMAAQDEWELNMLLLQTRLSEGAAQMIRDMGPAGAQAAAALVDATDEELARFEEVAAARMGGGVIADALYDGREVMLAAAAVLGQETADEIAAQIAAGETTVAEVVEKYDLAALVDLGADPTNYELTLGVMLGQTEESSATATIEGDATPYMGELDAALRETGWSSATATILGNAGPAFGVLGGFLNTVWGSSASTTTGTNTRPAESGVYGLLGWIGQQWATVNVQARYAGGLNMGGSAATMYSARAAGGIDDAGRYTKRQPMLAGPQYGRTNILWGEPETGWEAYISGHPQHKARNEGVLTEAASRLGYRIEKLAVGSMRYGDVARAMPTPAPTPAPTLNSSTPIDYDRLAAAMSQVQLEAVATLDARSVDRHAARTHSRADRGLVR